MHRTRVGWSVFNSYLGLRIASFGKTHHFHSNSSVRTVYNIGIQNMLELLDGGVEVFVKGEVKKLAV